MTTTVGPRVALALGLLFPAFATASDEVITESDAVRLFLDRSPQAQRIPLIEQSAGDARRVDAVLANPEITFETEDAGGVRDEFLTVRQELPIGGGRALVRASADAAATVANLSATRDLVSAASEVRESFYEVLYRERALERLRQGLQRIERVVDILRKREAEGEGSGYDLLRAEQEQAEIGAAVAAADASVIVARSSFGAFFDPERNMHLATLEGELRPDARIPETHLAIDRALVERGDLQALRTQTRRFELDRRAERRRRFPEPTLTAGWKRTESAGLHDSGFVAAVSVPLPVFDRGRLSAARADADRRHAELETTILERRIRADVRSALARERAANEAMRQLGDVAGRVEELRRIATLAFDEGEAGILELLDAHRTSLAAELRSLDVIHEARRAGIERVRAIGSEVKP